MSVTGPITYYIPQTCRRISGTDLQMLVSRMDGHGILQDWFHTNQWPLYGDSFQIGKRNSGYGCRSISLQQYPKYFLSLQLHAFFTGLAFLYSLLRENASRRNTVLKVLFYYMATTWSFQSSCVKKQAGKEKRSCTGTSLVVQWLRLHTSNAGGLGSIFGQETRSYMSQLKELACFAKKIPHAATKELMCPNYIPAQK